AQWKHLGVSSLGTPFGPPECPGIWRRILSIAPRWHCHFLVASDQSSRSPAGDVLYSSLGTRPTTTPSPRWAVSFAPPPLPRPRFDPYEAGKIAAWRPLCADFRGVDTAGPGRPLACACSNAARGRAPCARSYVTDRRSLRT